MTADLIAQLEHFVAVATEQPHLLLYAPNRCEDVAPVIRDAVAALRLAAQREQELQLDNQTLGDGGCIHYTDDGVKWTTRNRAEQLEAAAAAAEARIELADQQVALVNHALVAIGRVLRGEPISGFAASYDEVRGVVDLMRKVDALEQQLKIATRVQNQKFDVLIDAKDAAEARAAQAEQELEDLRRAAASSAALQRLKIEIHEIAERAVIEQPALSERMATWADQIAASIGPRDEPDRNYMDYLEGTWPVLRGKGER